MSNKRGPWTEEEIQYIEDNFEKQTPDEIASTIQRNPLSVRRYMEEEGMIKNGNKVSAASKLEYDIRKTPHWYNIVKQFDEDERELFLYHWNNTVKQFKEDIMHTEETQIIDMIKLEVMMNRVLNKQRRIEKQIEQIELGLEIEKSKDDEDRNENFILVEERKLAGLYTITETIGKEHRELLKQKNDILNKLKATREQRVKDVESSKDSMIGFFRRLHQDPQKRKEMGIKMEKMRLAMQVEVVRLSDLHTYIDNELDQPLLTPDTLIKE